MLTTKKKILCMCVVLVLLFTAIGVSLNLQKTAMAATEQTYFSEEKYTDSDNLLLPNGNLSSKTIIKFAEEVNAGQSGQEFPCERQPAVGVAPSGGIFSLRGIFEGTHSMQCRAFTLSSQGKGLPNRGAPRESAVSLARKI